MYKSIFFSFVVLFFVIGIVCVLSYLLIKAVAPDKSSKFYIVSVFGEKDRECSVKLSCVYSILSLLGLMSRFEIIAVDNGLTESERQSIADSFSKESRISILNTDELTVRLTSVE